MSDPSGAMYACTACLASSKYNDLRPTSRLVRNTKRYNAHKLSRMGRFGIDLADAAANQTLMS